MLTLIGVASIFLTVALHSVVTVYLVEWLKRKAPRWLERSGDYAGIGLVAVSTCVLTMKHALDIVYWAVVFWWLVGDQFDSFEQAVYFSSVTYTSVGYGDVVVTGPWQLLCGVEAINGMILFGLTIALLFGLVERLWIKLDEPDVDAP